MEFHTTRWTVVLDAADSQMPGADDALAELLQTYWRPLYQHARFRHMNHHDAQDGVQSFIAMVIEEKVIRRADPARGRFRSFLLTTFGNFLAKEYRKSTTMKRGGGTIAVSFDETICAEVDSRLNESAQAAEESFDREWAEALLAHAERQLAEARQTESERRDFEILRKFLAQDGADASRSEAAEALGISRETLKVRVHRLRGEFRKMLRQAVAVTVNGAAEVDDELRHLRRALAA